MRAIEKLTRIKPEIVALPEGFLAEAAKLPKPAASKPGEQRRHDGGGRGAPAGDPAKRRFPPKRPRGVGAHAGGVRRTGGR